MEPTTEQLSALKAFASEYGRKWKSELRYCWETCNYPSWVDAGPLQQIRNQFGPSWLVRFRFQDAA